MAEVDLLLLHLGENLANLQHGGKAFLAKITDRNERQRARKGLLCRRAGGRNVVALTSVALMSVALMSVALKTSVALKLSVAMKISVVMKMQPQWIPSQWMPSR